MNAPSNANTSGLEVVAWRIREQPGTAWTVVYDHEDHRLAIADGFESEPFAVTAASAQAEREQYGRWLVAMANDRDAEKARADRLAKALERIAGLRYVDPDSLNWKVLDLAKRIARAALQQETQP